MTEPKNKKDRERRMKLGIATVTLVTIAYYTDRYIGTYTGDWKVYAYVVGAIFAFIGGYITLTDIFGKKIK